MLKNLKFANKLLVFVLIVSIFPLLILAYLGYNALDQTLEKKTNDSVHQSGNSKAKEIDQWFKGKKIEVDAMANTTVLKKKQLSDQERSIYTAYNWWKIKERDEGVYDAQWSTDASGRTIIASPNDEGGVDSIKEASIADRDYWKPLISGNVVVSNPIISRSTGETAVVVAAPTIGDDGNPVGTVGNNILLTNIKKILKDINLSKNSFPVLISGNGTYIVHPDESMILSPENEKGKKVNEESDSLSKTISYLWDKESGKYKETEYKDREKLVSIYPISEADWKLVIVADTKELYAERTHLLTSFGITLLVVLLLIVVVGYLFIRSIKKPLTGLMTEFQKVSEGDLGAQIEVQSKDEFGILGNSFNSMISNIRHLVSGIKDMVHHLEKTSATISTSALEVSAASQEISQSIQEISIGAEHQADESGKSLEITQNLSVKVEEITDVLKRTVEHSHNMKSKNESGTQTVMYLDETFQKNQEMSKNVASSVSELSDKSKSIEVIVETINSISAQTNLLALNAAIEAARAGEHGKGFAVVADEVRKLAEESSRSTKEIQEIIRDITSVIESASGDMVTAGQMVKNVNSAIEDTKNVFYDMKSSVETVIFQVDVLKKDISEVDIAKNDVLSSIEHISSIAQQSAATTEEISATTEEQTASMEEVASLIQELEGMMKNLSKSVEVFKL